MRTLLLLAAWHGCLSAHFPEGILRDMNELKLEEFHCKRGYNGSYRSTPTKEEFCNCNRKEYPYIFVGALLVINLVPLNKLRIYEVGAFGQTDAVCERAYPDGHDSNGVAWYLEEIDGAPFFGFGPTVFYTGPLLRVQLASDKLRKPLLMYPKSYANPVFNMNQTIFKVWCCPEPKRELTYRPTPMPTTPTPTRQTTPIPTGPTTPMPTTPTPTRQATPRGSTRPPTPMPTRRPRRTPPFRPTRPPTPIPTGSTTPTPTRRTTPIPTSRSSARGPTRQPTPMSTTSPTLKRIPTTAPDAQVTSLPTDVPTASITATPTVAPSYITASPSSAPTVAPSSTPSLDTTDPPVTSPVDTPFLDPTGVPTPSIITTPTVDPSSVPSLDTTDPPATSPADAPFTDPTGVPIRVSARKKRMTLSA